MNKTEYKEIDMFQRITLIDQIEKMLSQGRVLNTAQIEFRKMAMAVEPKIVNKSTKKYNKGE